MVRREIGGAIIKILILQKYVFIKLIFGQKINNCSIQLFILD